MLYPNSCSRTIWAAGLVPSLLKHPPFHSRVDVTALTCFHFLMQIGNDKHPTPPHPENGIASTMYAHPTTSQLRSIDHVNTSNERYHPTPTPKWDKTAWKHSGDLWNRKQPPPSVSSWHSDQGSKGSHHWKYGAKLSSHHMWCKWIIDVSFLFRSPNSMKQEKIFI